MVARFYRSVLFVNLYPKWSIAQLVKAFHSCFMSKTLPIVEIFINQIIKISTVFISMLK